jgi:hypothetical protein
VPSVETAYRVAVRVRGLMLRSLGVVVDMVSPPWVVGHPDVA